MRVLVVGGGGREHALCWAIAASPLLTKLWCAPGNPGTAEHAENVPIPIMDIPRLVAFAVEHDIDLVLPGGEAPLAAGIADAMMAEGIACCGPSAAAARLEGSKSFTKEVCDAAGIPTALWERFDDPAPARDFVRRRGAPIVVKADGLASGKGVVVAASVAEAEAAIAEFTEGGRSIVIEECMTGAEISYFALCDGTNAIFLGTAQDHKRVGDGDTGPNTGGMGACSPTTLLSDVASTAVMDRIILPTVAEMSRQGTPFRGILYAGLMLTQDGPKLIEFNTRFGDPECQVLVLRLRSDLLDALRAACDGELAAYTLRWSTDAAIGVVMASKGYPGAVTAHTPIAGVEDAAKRPGITIFQAATTLKDNRLVSDGGRVLTICATAASPEEARSRAYAAVDCIDWPDGFCRRDIGGRGP